MKLRIFRKINDGFELFSFESAVKFYKEKFEFSTFFLRPDKKALTDNLQRLLNECIMLELEDGNYLGDNFSVNLKDCQKELDEIKQKLHKLFRLFYS